MTESGSNQPQDTGRQVVRNRLLAKLRSRQVALVEAGAGYGKSVLAWQFRRDLGIAAAMVPVGPPDDDPTVLMGSLRRALLASRLSDLAAVTGPADPAAGAERLLDILAQTPVPLLVVLDDAHHLRAPGVTDLVLRLARGLPAPHRLLVAARELAPGLEPLRGLASGACLGTRELEFTKPEAADLVAAHLGRRPSAWELNVLLEATRGWATALILAASSTASVDGLARGGGPAGPDELTIAPLLDPIIALLGPRDRAALVQLAHLPMLSAEIADAVSGAEGTLHRIIAAGVPVARTPGGWSEMPGPVVSYLACQHKLTAQAASTVARVYEQHGEPLAAVRTLLAAGLPVQAAATLAAVGAGKVEDLGLATLRDVIAELPGAAVREHPRVLLHLARVAEMTHRADIRAGALARAATILAERPDPVLRREVDAERARDLMWDERTRAESKALAAGVVASAAEAETTARARALDVLGRLASWFSAEGVQAEAEPLLLESARLARRIGQRTWEAQALVAVAIGFYFALCRYERALATLNEVLAQLPARSIYRVTVQSFAADVLVEQGRFGEAEASIEEIREIGTAYREEWAIAYAAWSEAALASYCGDRERTVRAVLEAEAHRDVWYDQADDAVARGDVDEAVRLLRRATECEPHDEYRYVRLARMLASQGRTGSARTTLERARARMAELGLPPSRPFVLLEGELTDFGAAAAG